MPRFAGPDPVVVVGLGRFGRAVADQLMDLGREVLAIDRDADLVQAASRHVTLAVEADGTDPDALRQLGVPDFAHAVVGIGSALEASVLATGTLSDLGVRSIWAKALTPQHGRILERVGATRVVYPEQDMGHRVAHLVTGTMNEYIDFPNGYAITMVPPQPALLGRTLAELGLRSRHGITVIGVETPDGEVTYATPTTVVEAGNRLVVAGRAPAVQAFADGHRN